MFPGNWLIFDETYVCFCCWTLFAMAILVNFDACFPNHGFDWPEIVFVYSSRAFFVLKVFLMCCFEFFLKLRFLNPTKKSGWKKSGYLYLGSTWPLALRQPLQNRDEHLQEQDWISCRMLAIFSGQDRIWVFIFEKNWIRTGSGYLLNFYNKISLKVI